MSETHKQHFVPQFYLEKWYDDKINKLYGLNLTYDTIKQYTTKQCCYAKDLYEYGKIKDNYLCFNEMEKYYGIIETQMGQWYKKIIPILQNKNNTNALILTKEEKTLVQNFIILTYIRNPLFDTTDFDRDLCNIEFAELISILNTMFNSDNWNELLTNMLKQEQSKIVYSKDNIIAGNYYRKVLECFENVYVFILKSNNKFITSDNPVSIGQDGIYFPLCPEFAILYVNKESYNKNQIIKPNKITILNDNDVMLFNSFYLKHRNTYLYSCDKTILEELKETKRKEVVD